MPTLTTVPRSAASAGPTATNTIIITNLTPAAFQNGGDRIRKVLEEYGNVTQFILIKSFSRILAVFQRTADAQRARRELHEGPKLDVSTRVYFGEHTDTTHLLNPEAGRTIDHLQVPALERNFLLSPPGSPPVDWVQIRESAPVAGGHSDALMAALRELEGDDFRLDDLDVQADEVFDVPATDRDHPGRHVLVFHPPPHGDNGGGGTGRSNVGDRHHLNVGGGGGELPVIVVENVDLDLPTFVLPPPSDDFLFSGRGPHHTQLPKTAMPPALTV
ncbi:hypothetical protein HKX48_009074 [Thoreauomyces humboldtii]|nr:hypothetical protein HKX48_009074 [Thoreauomyces humboldtii]